MTTGCKCPSLGFEFCSCPPEKGSPLQQIEQVEFAAAQLRGAAAALGATMRAALEARMPVGTTFDMYGRSNPPWLRSIRLQSGNARGATQFEIAGPVRVDVDKSHADLSRWYAEAFAISSKTGQRMNGKSHGADGNKPTVTISGMVYDVPHTNLQGADYGAYVKQHIVEFLSAK